MYLPVYPYLWNYQVLYCFYHDTKTCLTEENRVRVTWRYCSCCWQIPTGLPRNLESALQRYGSSSYKANAVTVLDQNGKPSLTLTYGTYQIEIQSLFVMNAIRNLYWWSYTNILYTCSMIIFLQENCWPEHRRLLTTCYKKPGTKGKAESSRTTGYVQYCMFYRFLQMAYSCSQVDWIKTGTSVQKKFHFKRYNMDIVFANITCTFIFTHQLLILVHVLSTIFFLIFLGFFKLMS